MSGGLGKKEFTERYESRHAHKFPQVYTIDLVTVRVSGIAQVMDALLGFKMPREIYSVIIMHVVMILKHSLTKGMIGKYHTRGIYKWEGDECDFHLLVVCSCGTCQSKEKSECKN